MGAFDEAGFYRKCEEEHAATAARVESEARLDDLGGVSRVVIAKVARRLLAELAEYNLVNICEDHFEDALRNLSEELGVPYVELLVATHAGMSNPETTRDDLAAWVAWCQQHAPERLTAQKGGA